MTDSLITAGGSGMGAACARKLVAVGVKVGILHGNGKALGEGRCGLRGAQLNQVAGAMKALADATVRRFRRGQKMAVALAVLLRDKAGYLKGRNARRDGGFMQGA